jgi:hypothetical protein
LKKCYDCEYFHIRQEPLRTPGVLWDMGLAECKKTGMVVDFPNHAKLKRLECADEEIRNN